MSWRDGVVDLDRDYRPASSRTESILTSPPTSRQLSLAEAGQASGVTVVIDVLRACTTQAACLARGASEIRLVSEVDEALAMRDEIPGALAMGEVDSRPVEGFDLSNSPVEVWARDDLEGRAIVHRSSAGTRGAVRAAEAGTGPMWGGAFVTASATAAQLPPDGEVVYVVTGDSFGRDGDEDRALADWLASLRRGETPDPAAHLERVTESDAGRVFGTVPWQTAEDRDFAMQIDRFDFALRIDVDDTGPVVRAVS